MPEKEKEGNIAEIRTKTWKKKLVKLLLKKWKKCFFLYIMKMSKKKLKFDTTEVNKKEFHNSKQPTGLNLVDVDQIVISDKFKYNDDGFKYFTGYKEDNIIRPLCIILPQRSGYTKYFENGGRIYPS